MRAVFLLLLSSMGSLPVSLLTRSKRKLIIDTDGGADDLMAIITALRLHGDREVVGVTTSCGNANATQAAVNVMKALRVLNRTEIPVHRGSESYYTTSTDLSSDWFGKDAIGDFEFPDPPTMADASAEHGVMALLRLVRQYAGHISLICLGPLTNVAHAIKLDPTFLENLDQLIVMGGSVKGIGNDSPGTEFNIRRDPDAASLVFQYSSLSHPVYLMPWETCLESRISKEWRRTGLGSIASPLMEFMNKVEGVELKRNTTDWHAPDTMAVLISLRPEFITRIDTAKVYVCTEGNLGRGVMLLERKDKAGNARVVEEINVDLLRKSLLRAFRA